MNVVYYPPFNTTASLTPCTLKQTILDMNSQTTETAFPEGWYMYLTSFLMITCVMFFLLLSFLTRYLSKRYFIYPIRKTCITHIALALNTDLNHFLLNQQRHIHSLSFHCTNNDLDRLVYSSEKL